MTGLPGGVAIPRPPVPAEFVISAVRPDQFPTDGLAEVALVGRSNVGKSSLINTLVGRKNLARTSNEPGRTQTLNFYRVMPPGQPRFYLVDLPGYGYAKVSRAMRQQWARLIEGYLRERASLVAVVQIVDFRHPPTADDQQMWDWLRYYGKSRLLVATKADKVGRSQWPQHEQTVRRTLRLQAGEPLVVFSAETGHNRDAVWGWLLEQLRQRR
ncbi:MAG: ribosome biogenesis GTP-binding protein YihA/YsxC [Firmicutes bacterium]|nr:ribosome biogenesis GTP-binding protein YihA/YsxC [Bacillota bacterium]